MLVAASVYTTEMQKLMSRWKLEGGLPAVPGQKVNSPVTTGAAMAEVPLHWKKDDVQILPKEVLGPTITKPAEFVGTYVIYDWDTREIIWEAHWGEMLVMPAGHCFADGFLYVTDLEGGNIFQIDVEKEPGKLLKRISHPYLNDVHSVERTTKGLLVTASGTDCILELDLDGNLLWEWWAPDHGYSMTPAGKERKSARGEEHRDVYYHTRYQTTHLNCANIQDSGTDRFVLCTLFHQGQLVRIDRSLPLEEQHATVILEGLARPHAIEKTPEGWLFANSLGKEVIFIDDDLKLTGKLEYDGGWIQDCTRLPDGTILLNDVDKHQLVEFSGPPYEITKITPYRENWRMGELVVVPAEYEQKIRSSVLTAAS